MNNSEEFLILDEKNFDDHIVDIKRLFGVEPKEPGDLILNLTSGGGIEYRLKPNGREFNDKTFYRYVINQFAENARPFTRPRFFLRMNYEEGLTLLIEYISEAQLQKWKDQLSLNKDYFSRRGRYRPNGSDTVFWEASDNAYLKYSIKRERLSASQLEDLRMLIEQFFLTVRIPNGNHDTNKYEVERFKAELEELTKKEIIKKPRKKVLTA
jgi:hypothetical protein